jgi:hypothetical protein
MPVMLCLAMPWQAFDMERILAPGKGLSGLSQAVNRYLRNRIAPVLHPNPFGAHGHERNSARRSMAGPEGAGA